MLKNVSTLQFKIFRCRKNRMDSTFLVDSTTKESFKINSGILNFVQWEELLKVLNGLDQRGQITGSPLVQDTVIQ